MPDNKNSSPTNKRSQNSMDMIVNIEEKRSKTDVFCPSSKQGKNEITQMYATPPKPGSDSHKVKK